MIIIERNCQLHFVENYKYFYIFPIIFSCHRNFIFDFLYGQKFSIYFFFIKSLYKTFSIFFIHTNLSCFKLSNNACYWDSKFVSICLIKWYESYRIFIHVNIFYILFCPSYGFNCARHICTYKKWRRKNLTWKWLKFVYIDIMNDLFLP